MNSMTENVFEIDDPDACDCLVRMFSIGHGILNVLVRRRANPRDKFYAVFSAVEYFSGTIRWSGANFCTKSDEETIAILRKVERFKNIPDEKLLKPPPYRLYEVRTSNDIIQIVAGNAGLHPHMVK